MTTTDETHGLRCLVVTLRPEGGGSWWWIRWLDGRWVDDLLPGQTHGTAWAHESDLPRDTDRVLYLPTGDWARHHRTGRVMADHRDAVRAWTGRTPAVDVNVGPRAHDPARWHPASNPKRLVRWPRAGWR